MGKAYLGLIILFCLTIGKSEGQITLGSFNSGGPTLSSYNEVMAGTTVVNYMTFQISNIPYGTNLPAGWTLKIRANANFSNGASSIPSQYVSLKFRSVDVGPSGVSGSAVPLTSTNANLITTSVALTAPNDYYVAQKFDMIIQGGNHLLVPTGTYSTTLTLSMYDRNGNLLATNGNVPVSFTINYSNSCSGAALNGSAGMPYNFDTYQKLQSGGTATDALTIQYSPYAANCIGWSLKVRANGNFINGSSSVSPQYVSLRFNRVSMGSPSAADIGISSNAVPLGMSDVVLEGPSMAAFQAYNFTEHKFDMVIQGGNHLLLAKNTGTYSCPLTFSLYNQSGQLVSSVNVNASFQISYANSVNYSIALQNPDVAMLYNTPASYTAGVSVTKTKGLKIVGFSPYQVIVKTTGPNLTGSADNLPVSLVRLENTPPSGKPGISSVAINLSSADQVIITNNMNDYTYQTIEYDLRYSIAGGNTTINTAKGGTYTTQVIYVILPK
ncbi:hypothetical protein [Pedobacter nutrimenti]|uniref:Uncharacterized protein n=1 Tax=Pedobacter nutrimenti TaxID=1241337 RepID=A0A318UNA8_9SPHI|nr:hypothetical protein [Pedobacter nutrimenti]PYF76568.1 hypothetical protein B0O44_10139 [Pedobacter nutrimenti]